MAPLGTLKKSKERKREGLYWYHHHHQLLFYKYIYRPVCLTYPSSDVSGSCRAYQKRKKPKKYSTLCWLLYNLLWQMIHTTLKNSLTHIHKQNINTKKLIYTIIIHTIITITTTLNVKYKKSPPPPPPSSPATPLLVYFLTYNVWAVGQVGVVG